ncbi:MAG: hypothetical protein ACLGH0_00295 [Thermoanaerobaculia bacterium]
MFVAILGEMPAFRDKFCAPPDKAAHHREKPPKPEPAAANKRIVIRNG